jgi:hypothetical protein
MKRCLAIVTLTLAHIHLSLAAASALLPFQTLWQSHHRFNEHWVTVRGYVAIDSLGNAFLFEALPQVFGKKYTTYGASIDLLPLAGGEKSYSLLRNGACAEVYGRFEAYDSHTIPSGYLLSQAGLIKVRRVESCPGR